MATLTKVYKIEIDGKQANATVGQLKTEIKQLEEALELVEVGSAEADEAIRRLGNARGALKELDDAVDALDPKNKAAAFSDFANGIVGGFAVATTAAETFGLSSTVADEYREKLDTLLVTMSGVEQISRALNSETLSVVKSTLTQIRGLGGLAKAYVVGGEAASTAGKVTRAALISTGIGALIVAVGLLIAYWDDLKNTVKGSEQFFTKVKATASGLLDGLIAQIKNTVEVVKLAWEGDYSEAIAKARNVGAEIGAAYRSGYQESLVESSKAGIQLAIEERERYIEILKAKGKDTYALERENLLARIRIAEEGNAEEKKAKQDLIRDLAVLNVANREKLKQEEQAADLAASAARIGRLEAAGKDVIKAQLDQKRLELIALKSASDRNEAAIIAKQGEIDALLIQQREQAAEKARAQLVKSQQREIELLDKQGQDTLELRIQYAKELLDLDEKDQSNEVKKQRYQDDLQAYKLLLEERKKLDNEAAQYRTELGQDLQGQAIEERNNFNKAVLEGANNAVDQAKAIASRAPDFGRDMLEKFFGVDPKKSAALKEALTQIAGEVFTALEGLAGSFLSAALQDIDAELEAAQTRFDEVSSKLDESRGRREAAEQALKTASGAKREYLLGVINQERQAEERLAAQKAKAAREQQAAEKEKHRLEKISQQLAAGSAAATAAATAVSAGYAAVKAVEKGSEIPFPLNLVAIGTGLAAVISAVAAAKNLRQSMKYRDGVTGLTPTGVLIGPSHEQGGVQLWSRSGRHYGEAEGGEAITPVDATRRNAAALELIRTQGRTRTLTPADFATVANTMRVLPAPAPVVQGRYADGGIAAPTGRTASVGGSSAVADTSALESKLDRNNALLERILGETASTARSSAITAAKPGAAPRTEETLLAEDAMRDNAKLISQMNSL